MPVIIKNGKTYGDRSVTLSKAEYDALSSAEKLNGTVYYIYDSNENMGINVELTQAQYDALVDPDPDTVYYITDGTVSYPTAEDMRYQEGVSVADALDTLNARLGAKLLWSGNFSGSGSFTVNGLSEWLVVGYTSYESATNVEYLMIGTPARGGQPYGVYDSTSTTVVAYRFVVDGDTVTVNKQNRGLHFNSSTTYDNGSDAHVRHVFGLIKKPSSN